MTWGKHPIIQNAGTIVQVLTSNSSGFPYTNIYAANSKGDIFQFNRGQSDTTKQIYTGDSTLPSQLAYAQNSLFSVLNGTVFIGSTSGLYIYKYFNNWTEFGVQDTGSPALMGSLSWLYTVFPAGVLRYDFSSQKWDSIGGPGKMFVCNEDTIFGISPGDDSVFEYVSGSTWKKIRAQATASIVAGGKILCAVDKQSGNISKYNGTPDSWTEIGNPGKMFTMSQKGALYGMTGKGHVYQYNGTPKSWTEIGTTPAGHIFAGGGVLCATSPDDKAVWCYADDASTP